MVQNEMYQFVVLCGELGEPLVILQDHNDGHQISGGEVNSIDYQKQNGIKDTVVHAMCTFDNSEVTGYQDVRNPAGSVPWCPGSDRLCPHPVGQHGET
jgi:hypothetical protein